MTMRIPKSLAWLSAFAVLVLSLSPPRYRIVTGAARELEHFTAFALVGLMLSLAYPERRLKLVVVGIGAIAVIELLQIFVPGRHAYLSDFLLNALGLCVGTAGSLILARISVRGGGVATKAPSATSLGDLGRGGNMPPGQRKKYRH
jgi:VanZ family protein